MTRFRLSRIQALHIQCLGPALSVLASFLAVSPMQKLGWPCRSWRPSHTQAAPDQGEHLFLKILGPAAPWVT